MRSAIVMGPMVKNPPATYLMPSTYHGATIELARRLSSVSRSVYGFHRQGQDSQLSMRVQYSMQDLQAWVERLQPRLQIDLSSGATDD